MFRYAPMLLLVILFIPSTLAAQIGGDLAKTFDSFVFSMTSQITIADGDDVTEIGVKLENIKLTFDEAEDAYVGAGDLVHTKYDYPLGEGCWIEERIYRSDRFFIRIEVDEYFDAAPDVRLFMRIRGTTAFTMPGEGSIVAFLTDVDTLRFTVPAVPVWAAGWFVIRDDVGEAPSEPHGWPIKDIKVDGWEITGIEEEDFRIHKELDHTFVDDEGQTFRERATYVIEPCIRYETAFEMGSDNYTFGNQAENVWPESYWSQFDYSVEGDVFQRVTGSRPANYFPDWYAFSRAFGEEQTYRSVFPKVQRPQAMLRWRAMNREFKGTCYGFAYSSLLHYCGYRSALPQPLGALGTQDIVLEELHEKHCYQMSREAIWHTFRNAGMRPKELVKSLIESFKDDGAKNRALSILLPGYGHTMVPLALSRCFDDEKDEVLTRVEVWDNDYPSEVKAFTVNETQNVIVGDNGNLSRGFFTDVAADVYEPTYPVMFKGTGAQVRPTLLSADRTEVYYDGGVSAMLQVPGYDAVDVNALDLDAPQDVFPICIRTGVEPIIPGYTVETSVASSLRLDVETGGGEELLTSIGAAGVLDLSYRAPAGSTLRVDLRNDDLAMDISTGDGVQDAVLQLVRGGEDADLLARISELDIEGQSGITAAMGEGTNIVTLHNPGAATTYALELISFGAKLETSGVFTGQQIRSGERHAVVVGSADSLRTTSVALHVDRDGDGSVDEVRVLRDYGMVSVESPAVISEDLRAWPAPWHPDQRPLQIRYALQRSATVRLVVYNALQQEVAELVPPQAHASGSPYTVTWNGGGVPSGTYFYVLEAVDGSRALGKIAVVR